jgi:peptidoglycan hydrolase-like protein with peptidoglycan-binding domain
LPDLRVRAAQIYLTYKGFAPGAIDGIMGSATAAAIRRFQHSTGASQTGIVDDALIAQLST